MRGERKEREKRRVWHAREVARPALLDRSHVLSRPVSHTLQWATIKGWEVADKLGFKADGTRTEK